MYRLKKERVSFTRRSPSPSRRPTARRGRRGSRRPSGAGSGRRRPRSRPGPRSAAGCRGPGRRRVVLRGVRTCRRTELALERRLALGGLLAALRLLRELLVDERLLRARELGRLGALRGGARLVGDRLRGGVLRREGRRVDRGALRGEELLQLGDGEALRLAPDALRRRRRLLGRAGERRERLGGLLRRAVARQRLEHVRGLGGRAPAAEIATGFARCALARFAAALRRASRAFSFGQKRGVCPISWQ